MARDIMRNPLHFKTETSLTKKFTFNTFCFPLTESKENLHRTSQEFEKQKPSILFNFSLGQIYLHGTR